MPSQEVLSALHDLHKELEKLEPAIRHIETAELVTRTVKDIPEKHQKLLEEIKREDKAHKQELKALFQEQVNSMVQDVNRVIESNDSIQTNIRHQLGAIEKLRSGIQTLYEKIDRINFPQRLDKLDATVSGIMTAVQSIQGRLDIIERNLTDRLRDIAELHRETHKVIKETVEKRMEDLSSSIQQFEKKRNVLTYITWLIILTAACCLFFLK